MCELSLALYIIIIRTVRGQAELLILKIGNAKALVRDKRQKVYSRALFVSTHLKLNQPRQGEWVGKIILL